MKKKDWLKLAEVKALIEEGLTDAEIGRALGSSRDTVKHFRRVHGLPCNPEVRAAIGAAGEDVVRRLAARGFSDAAVGRVLGVTLKAVFEVRKRLGIRSVRVLGPDVVKQLKRMVREKLTDREIGAALGRSIQSVRRIRRQLGIKRTTKRTTKRRAK